MNDFRTAEQIVADAMRMVAAKLIVAINEKYINRSTLDDTLSETLLAIADELDPELDPE